MLLDIMDCQTFLRLSTREINDLISKRGLPKVGVFIPDGNRRLILATTNLKSGTDEFFNQLAVTQTFGFFENLKTFFSHGLNVLFSPLFSRSVLMRGTRYCQLTVLKTLRTLFTDQTWLDFYCNWEIKVHIYGDLSILKQKELEEASEWIDTIKSFTGKHKNHFLYLGIGGEPRISHDVFVGINNYYREYQRGPKMAELISHLYGSEIPPADFVIMSSKFGGIGAIPSLICTGNTRMYYLPVPGVLGLNESTYRDILFDLLFVTEENENSDQPDDTVRQQVRAWYTDHKNIVIGLGKKIGPVWIPDLPGLEGNQ